MEVLTEQGRVKRDITLNPFDTKVEQDISVQARDSDSDFSSNEEIELSFFMVKPILIFNRCKDTYLTF